MRSCVRLSNGPQEADGFHALLEDPEQDLFDRGTHSFDQSLRLRIHFAHSQISIVGEFMDSLATRLTQ